MKAVFLDRDGTINIDTGYTYKVEDLRLEQKAIQGLKIMQNLGYLLVIVTGQSGIGRGFYTEQDYQRFMEKLSSMLEENGIKIVRDYFCPHHPTEGIGKYKLDCQCRKPKPRLLEKAAKELKIDLSESWVIGDKTDDIEMGRR